MIGMHANFKLKRLKSICHKYASTDVLPAAECDFGSGSLMVFSSLISKRYVLLVKLVSAKASTDEWKRNKLEWKKKRDSEMK